MGLAGLSRSPEFDIQHVMPRVERLCDELTGGGQSRLGIERKRALSLDSEDFDRLG